jgi:hypothetical protein
MIDWKGFERLIAPRSSSAQLKKVSINEESSPVVRRDQTVSPCNGERLRNGLKVNKNKANPGNVRYANKKKRLEAIIFWSGYFTMARF